MQNWGSQDVLSTNERNFHIVRYGKSFCLIHDLA